MRALAAIVGDENVIEGAGTVQLLPADEGEVAAILRLCTEQRLVVSPVRGRTKLGWGNPVKAGVQIDLQRLSGVREHVWQDLTATVAAGTVWSDMQAALAAHKQRVALDPIFPRRASVGGVMAINDSGSLRLRYGSLRDLVLGATVVLADGTIARSGGKVVKNVAGYDLPKLLTGSFGTLGVITEVTFRLHGLPPATASWTVRCDDIVPLAGLMGKLLESEFSVEALQLRSWPAASQPGFAVDVRFAGSAEILQGNKSRLLQLAAGCETSEAAADVWTQRERLFSNPNATVWKVTALPSKLAGIVTGFAELSRNGQLSAQVVADAVGIVTAALAGAPEVAAGILEDLRARLRADGGMVVVLCRGSLGTEVERWGGSTPAVEVMRAIKAEFDPLRILNPGKFVGGI